MRYYTTEAIIIKTRTFGESDKIYTVLSPEYGKFEAKARAANAMKSKLSGRLRLFSVVKLYLAKGKKTDIITGVETLVSHDAIRPSLEHIAAGFYLLEIFDKAVIEHQKDYPLYALLKQAMQSIAEYAAGKKPVDVLLRSVEFKLLQLSGYEPVLDGCAACKGAAGIGAACKGAAHKGEKNNLSYMSVLLGGLICDRCYLDNRNSVAIHPATKEVMKFFRSNDIRRISRIKLREDVLKNLFKIHKLFYETHFGFKIFSSEFMEQVKQQKEYAGV